MNDRPSYPWSEGDALFASELNAAIANAGGGDGGGVSILDFGAKCDGVANDTVAVNTALTSGANRVTIPAGKCCYLPNGITVPSGVALEGLSFFSQSPRNGTTLSPPSSSILTNANINSVTLGSGANLQAVALRNLVIVTNATSAPTSGAGVYVNTGAQVRCDNVLVYNAYNGFYWKTAGANGIIGWMDGCQTDQISGHHVVQDTWPELRLNMCRFTGAYGALAYVYMTGGAGSGDILPNGHFATNCQYNENGPDVGALVLAGGMMSGSLAQEVHFVNCHSEHSSYIVRTDATEPGLLSFVFVGGTHFYTADFFRLDPATTSITQFRIAACNLEGPSFTMAAQFFVDCQVVGTYIGSNVALSGGGTLAFSGNSVFGNLALSGNWTALVVNTTLRGSFSNTATGAVSVAIPGNSIVLGAPVSGADFGSHTASGVTDLSRHVQLYTGYAGINVTASAMNFVIAGAAPLSVIEGSNSGLLAARLAGSLSYANDAAAAAGGIPVGVLYRNGSVVQVRVA